MPWFFIISDWLIWGNNISKGGYYGSPCSYVFLRMLLSSSWLMGLWIEWKTWSLDAVGPHSKEIKYFILALVMLTSHTLWVLGILCPSGTVNTVFKGKASNGGHSYSYRPSANAHPPSSHRMALTKHIFRDKMIKNIRKVTAEYETWYGEKCLWIRLLELWRNKR